MVKLLGLFGRGEAAHGRVLMKVLELNGREGNFSALGIREVSQVRTRLSRYLEEA